MDAAEGPEQYPGQLRPIEGPELYPGQLRPVTVSSGQSSITIYPPTVKTLQPRPAGAVSKLLDAVVPKKLGAGGKVTIWGLPPAVAYTLVAVILAGGGLLAYQKITGRQLLRNPRRRGSRGRGRARSKR